MEQVKEYLRMDFNFRGKKYYVNAFNPVWWGILAIDFAMFAVFMFCLLILPCLIV